MTVEHVEVLVEEPSVETTLRSLLPRMLGGVSFEVYPHQCKQDLLARLPDRLRGYSHWLPTTWRVVVVVDRDDDDCHELKGRLEQIAADSGLPTRTRPGRGRWSVANRLAIEELEAWFFGDWDAVRAAYPRVPEMIPAKEKYRDPDAISGGTWEALQSVLQRAGYFAGGIRKIELAASIAPHMAFDRNRSRSFRVFRDTFQECVTQ